MTAPPVRGFVPAQPTTAWEDEPIRRTHCLATVWLGDDPYPTICALKVHDDDTDHQAHGHDGQQGVTWGEEAVEGAA